ncbi:ATP synthase subunit a-like [Apium graveolens]|uniref:ATP synthase subunit a-like n=1 Tax=Apium graveolens TaxID=4045 RepID=UPI003D7917CC
MPIFRRFDENSLNSNQTYTTKSFTSKSEPEPTTTMTINDYAFNPSAASGAQAQALNERAVELRAGIHDVLGELMVNRSPDEVLRAAEAVHESSNEIAFLECLLNDLHINGVESEAFAETLFLAGQAPTIPSPLEQFSILPLIPMNIGHLYFSFTNPSLFMLLTLGLVLLLVHFVTKNGGGNSVPNAWQSLVELIYDFVPNPVNEQIGGLSGNVKQKFSPRISVTFTFSFFRNPQGMIPYSFTVTSHFLITLGLSFSIFIGITLVGFYGCLLLSEMRHLLYQLAKG